MADRYHRSGSGYGVVGQTRYSVGRGRSSDFASALFSALRINLESETQQILQFDGRAIMQRMYKTSQPTVFRLGRFYITAETAKALRQMGKGKAIGKRVVSAKPR